MGSTNWRAGGPCFQMKNITFRWAGRLHKRQKGKPTGCKKGWGGLQKRVALRPAFSVAHPVVQPALLCSSPARRKFMFFIWQHGTPALCLVLSTKIKEKEKTKVGKVKVKLKTIGIAAVMHNRYIDTRCVNDKVTLLFELRRARHIHSNLFHINC